MKTRPAAKVDVIGQFGVGFYSAFMVASRVTVRSRAFGAQEAWQWESTGAEGYTIEPCDKEDVGTEVILVVKENEGEEHYDEFLDDWRLAGIVQKILRLYPLPHQDAAGKEPRHRGHGQG